MSDSPPSFETVDVWFDGALIRDTEGNVRLWGYGYKVSGAGLDRADSHASIFGNMIELVALFAGMGGEDRSEVPSVIRSVHVADLEGAFSALHYLRERGFAGRVRMYGDSKSLMERLAAGSPVRPGVADARAIAHREKLIREVGKAFASVDWCWVPEDQNREADALAWDAVHDVIEHKKLLLKSARTHPERGAFVALGELFTRAVLPGHVADTDLQQMQCMCGRCRPAHE